MKAMLSFEILGRTYQKGNVTSLKVGVVSEIAVKTSKPAG
jgi:ribosomal protein S28E/S33